MRRSADEIGATSVSFGRKCLAIRHRLLTEFFPPIESARQESLRTGDRDDDVKQAIANKIIELAKTGERNPDLLCARALEAALADLCRQREIQRARAAERDPAAPLTPRSEDVLMQLERS